jgi:hypothetical protein
LNLQTKIILQSKLVSFATNPPNLGYQVSLCTSFSNRVVQLYPKGTGFPFNRLLKLARTRWRYYNLPQQKDLMLIPWRIFFIEYTISNQN